jgi:hypothetical protein
VFKYADAVVKTFATASTTVLLVIFSAVYLSQKTTVVAWMGVLVVVVATYVFGKLKEVQAQSPPPALPTEEKEQELETLLDDGKDASKA